MDDGAHAKRAANTAKVRLYRQRYVGVAVACVLVAHLPISTSDAALLQPSLLYQSEVCGCFVLTCRKKQAALDDPVVAALEARKREDKNAKDRARRAM